MAPASWAPTPTTARTAADVARQTASERADLEGAAGVSSREVNDETEADGANVDGADLDGDGEVDQADDDAAAIAGEADERPRVRPRGPAYEPAPSDEWGEWDIPPGIAPYLKPDEDKAMAMRRHVVRLIAPAVAVVGGLLAAIAANAWAYSAGHASPNAVHVIWLAYLVAAAWGIYKYLEWRQTWFVVTEFRVMLIETTHLLGRRVRMLPIDKLRDLEYSQTSIGRMWGYATFTFASIGTGGNDKSLSEVDALPFPEWLYQQISALIMPTPTKRLFKRGPR